MKSSLYLSYASRSLLRGGQRTVLAIFCIAVGVMAIVSLQLVGEMINRTFTSNVREANGGDIAVSSFSVPLKDSDLSFFDHLKTEGKISSYTATSNYSGSVGASASAGQHFSLETIDPETFPVVSPPPFVTPSDGSFASLVKETQVVVDQSFADQYDKKVGDSFDVHVTSAKQGGFVLHVQIVGLVANKGLLAQNKGLLFVAKNGLQAAQPDNLITYQSVYIATTDQAQTDAASKAIKKQFPLETVQTSDDALKSAQDQVALIKKFLDIAGLLALLIGGVGIVNTMQVLLSRRKTEIAMLKTVGYRRFDLYFLFGLEAGFLGLIGGIIGAALATGVSAIVLNFMERLFSVDVPFVLDPLIIGGGVLIGLITALIFGLLPIVQAANIRPLNVIREIAGGNRVASIFLTIGLLFILSVLFCLMAVFILNDVVLGISAVYGTFVFLIILSAFFAFVVWLIGILPVRERFNIWYLLLILGGIIISLLLTLALPTFGILLLLVSLMGIVIVLLPRSTKASTRMALRNIGRQPARTTTTLLALFVGVFTIGLVLVLGEDIRGLLDKTIATTINFNVLALAQGSEGVKLKANLSTVPGLSHSEVHPYAPVLPLTIDDQPVQTLLAAPPDKNAAYSLPPSVDYYYLSSFEGYDLANDQTPSTQTFSFQKGDGRNLDASDVGTNNVIVSEYLSHLPPLKGHIHLGSQIALASQDGKITRTVTVVGFYTTSLSSDYGAILSPSDVTSAFATPNHELSVFYMKIDADKVGKGLNEIGKIAPNASVTNYANIGDFINGYIANIIQILTAIASLSLLAGVIIIANAVALAMLERRRELGILKSVGYTSRNVLGEVVLENAIVGATGALLAMLLVTLVTSILDRFVFKSGFGVSWYISIGLIVGIALLAVITATLVAWGSVRVRPLEVLRYE
ncbi:ABC transporter permease [Tengunoibacter tsumagoiensis]|uniref:Glycosyl transferase family 1 n=1 Tax=Tengunoibacter tsumagoiensis TaxID=2014871 RepID=A0A402A248_9CHLR|nr:FtsX-like permease family protein [Tengunoibacter tsumagoiensis]GCE13132.1 glycosyl transferase family 1 [Tengunoibacter tsumagoiensis]